MRPHLLPRPKRSIADGSPAVDQEEGESRQPRIDVGEVSRPQPPAASVEESLPAWADRLAIPYWSDLRSRTPSVEFVERVPIGFARRNAILAFVRDGADPPGDSLPVAIGGPQAWPVLDVVGRYLKRAVLPVAAPEEEILAAINRAYQRRDGQAASLVEVLDPEGCDGSTARVCRAGGSAGQPRQPSGYSAGELDPLRGR